MLPPPAACPFVFAGLNRSGTRRATDAWIPAIVQRVIRHVALADVLPHFVVRPLDERIYFDEIVRLVPFDLVHGCACDRLLATQSRDPRIETGQRAPQRLHLANAAAQLAILDRMI